MYKFFKDKTENFECSINIEGASLNNAKARLILENEEFSLVFDGTIDKMGKCIIPVKKLKILSEDLRGKLKLEVIVDDDTYFLPYEDNFTIGLSKKLTVEVVNKDNTLLPNIDKTKKVIVEVKSNDFSQIVNEIFNKLDKKDINIYNLSENKKIVSPIIQEVINKYKIEDTNLSLIKNQLLEKLSKSI